ncbi:MAG TPA: DUF4870 domain-containing protein [Aggregatilineales bacterium]|nr:DUF4870 domain-containing protein [Aggregatilineales bacterium]
MFDPNPTDNDKNPEVKIPVNAPDDSIEGVEVPYVDTSHVQSEAEVDRMVHEYEDKYASIRRQRIELPEEPELHDEEKPKNDWKKFRFGLRKMSHDLRPSSISATTTEEERLWATIAHVSALVTLLIGVPTGGIAALLTLFIPLAIYFAFRNRSEFVANQALQSFALQVVCTVGVAFTAVALVLVAALVTVVLAITIVGILAIPFLWLAIALVLVVLLALPLGMGILGIVGAWESYQGRLFRYPYIANWIDEQMHGRFLRHL